MASINTNYGAMSALSTLRANETQVNAVSKQLETGYRVADSYDDASVFAVAQGIRSNFKANAAVQSSLQQGVGLVDVSVAALNGLMQLSDSPLWTSLPFVRRQRISVIPGVLMFGMVQEALRFSTLVVDTLEISAR